MLSRILEKISGENYNEILSKNIVEKLHLKNTHSLADRSQNIFKSYEENSGKWIPIEELEFKNAIGLGAVSYTHL